MQNATPFVNVPSTEVDKMEDPIGDGDPLKIDLMPSTSADDNSHEADVVADESFIVDEIVSVRIHWKSGNSQKMQFCSLT